MGTEAFIIRYEHSSRPNEPLEIDLFYLHPDTHAQVDKFFPARELRPPIIGDNSFYADRVNPSGTHLAEVMRLIGYM